MDEIVRYMKNEYDISELNGMKWNEFCRELIETNIPFKISILNKLFNNTSLVGVG